MVAGVGDEQIAISVDRHSVRVREQRFGCRTAISAESSIAGETRIAPRHCANDAGRSDLADAVVLTIRNEQVTRLVCGDVQRTYHQSGGRRAAISTKTSIAHSCQGADDTREVYPPDATVVVVRNQ